MKASDLRSQDGAGLEKTLLELRKEQFNLRMQHSTGQLTNSSQVTAVRKDIARVKTVINEKLKAGS
ncbi:MAG: 50S ribosomal protein L29 [gamma proteobacterium symbiont of Bathyaustriella thionipta]|nr:50S ribosomal protein L29 [gamma proteobacterium symbiont of Bathyaustriella thionipta]